MKSGKIRWISPGARVGLGGGDDFHKKKQVREYLRKNEKRKSKWNFPAHGYSVFPFSRGHVYFILRHVYFYFKCIFQSFVHFDSPYVDAADFPSGGE